MNPQQPSPVVYPVHKGPNKNLIVAILIILLIAAVAFGYWAFSGRQDYKNNSDKKAAAAATTAKAKGAADQKTADDQQNKQPYKNFKGSPTYGSITFNYPKTWSGYIDTSNSSEPINGYFYPDTVPGIQSKTAYALRVELINTDYSQLLQQFSSQISQGQVTAKAYTPPKMQGVSNVAAGTYLSGQINSGDQTQQGSMVIIKVRDKTLEIYTESNDFLSDFNNIVLANLSFAP
jgi:hypothetical protein